MSVNADFYSFSKRKNSTKQPTGTPTQISVDLKSGTSYISPTFLLSLNTRPTFNYVVYEGWYYFITDIISVRNDLWEIVCEVDALATARTEILATTAYILYDTDGNTEIPDNRLPMQTSATLSIDTATCPLTPSSGIYILSLTGAHGSTGVYKVTSSELAALIDDLNHIKDNIFDFNGITPPVRPTGSINIFDWLQYIGDVLKYMFDCAVLPIQQFFGSGNIPENIRECKFIPFSIGNATLTVDPVYLGTFKTQQKLHKLTSETEVNTASVTIPWQSSDYTRRSPYTELYIYLPYIGMIRLSPENLIDETSIDISYCVGLRDGDLIVTLTSDGGEIIGQYSGNVAASVPVGFSNINIPKAAGSVIAGMASAMQGNVGNVGMAALSFGDSVTPNYSSIGGLNGVAGIGTNQDITIYSVYHAPSVAPNSDIMTIGAPTMAPKTISTLINGGYCQCLDAHVEAALPSTIIDTVDNYLNSGFFIE